VKKHVKVLLIGVVVFVVGIVLAIAVPLMLIKDPADEARHTLDYSTAGSKLVDLGKGEYDVWTEEYWLGGTASVEITNTATDELVFSGPDSDTTETMNGKVRVGTFKVTTSGEHRVYADGSTTVYITDPINVGGLLGGMCTGFIVALVGAIIGAVGFFMWLGARKQQAAPQYMYPTQQYPTQQYPAQQYPTQQYPTQQYPTQPPQQPQEPPSQTQPPQRPQ
jgi:flagellar basal body-associated protein FliL